MKIGRPPRIRLGASALSAAIALLVIGASSAAPPPLRLPDNITAGATSSAGASVTYQARAQDSTNLVTCDGPGGGAALGTLNVTATFPIGTTTVNCTATDTSGGLVASGSFTVTVVDDPPVVTVPSDMTVHTTSSGGTPVTYTASASDAVDGTLTPSCSPASGSTFVVGTTSVNCSATDSAGHTTNASFAVTVVFDDTTPPVVTVPGNVSETTEDPAGKTIGFSPAPSATDNVDGTLPVSCTPTSGSVFPVGLTTVTCTATDTHGNTGSASFTVTISLVDTTKPEVTVPADITVETSDTSAVVPYTASANDNLDGSIEPSCTPASGASFPVGTTTVTCTATDTHGNSASKTFTVTVVFVDHTAPTLSAVPNIQAEANSPSGSIVNFTTPTATDNVDGPIAGVDCAPGSGSTFPLGITTVTCSATDAHGNTGSASFTVRVVDTTPPHLIVPRDFNIYATTPLGLPSSSEAAIAYLTHYSVSDIVDPSPTVTTDAPSLLPVGNTVITFTARDASGNAIAATSTLTIRPQPAPGTTPEPLPPLGDIKAPDDVRSLTAKSGDGVVTLTWKPPTVTDFASVVVTRSPAAGGPATVVYKGNGTTFADHGVQNGVEYRYVVVSVDKSGNASAGAAVVAKPERSMLRAPADGARLRKAPRRLSWLPADGATYYNVQLFRGNVKILSAWPTKASLTLAKTWKYQGTRYRLTRGVYQWFVWPGIGARAKVQYGPLLGSSTFQIVR
jgi:fibronectin type 3 domain-containing protein